MVGSDDPFWAHVEVNNDSVKCKFCWQSFAPTTSISRIKWHLSGEKGHGVAICGEVPERIQQEAFQAMSGVSKRHKSTPSSSNTSDTAPSLRPREQHDGVATYQVGQLDVEGTNWEAIASIAQLMEVDTDNGTGRQAQPVAGASSSKELPYNTSHETIGDALPVSSIKLVGQAFEKNKKMIWSWLMNDDVSLIGIYGMGGVGKTSLVKHIYNQLLGRLDIFYGHVCWITVSQDFSISRLQNNIAKRIDLDLSYEDDEVHRAIKLSRELTRRKKWVLIFDDLWNCFELDKVGIPIQMKGCKVILTTRSLKVCQGMFCQEMMKVEPLLKEEAWTLFMEKLGQDGAPSSEMEQIAKSITRECDGLPLGIITMAGAMRGVIDICEWRDSWEELKESKVRKDDLEPEVFKVLKFSYNHLNDSMLQQCFLCCALFPEDYRIDREQLIGYLIDEGIIQGMKSRRKGFDKGHTMINKLVNVCLLENCQELLDDRAVKMHDLIRDMALQIQQETSQIMVKAGEQLKELPDVEEWEENLVRVSVMENQIHEISRSHSPRCPNLSTIFLQSNRRLGFIADSFFKHLGGLRILNLSDTDIEILPDSVSDLVALVALLLRSCPKLRHVPSLKKLSVLMRLDLGGGTALENMPQDMEWLANIRYLILNGCGQKEFPMGILPKLSHLQAFVLEEQFCLFGQQYAPVTVKGKEVGCLRKLETLECHFEHPSDLAEYLNSQSKTHTPSTYWLFVGQWDGDEYAIMKDYPRKSKTVALGDFGRGRDFRVFVPKDIEELWMHKCSLSDISSLIQHATELEVIRMKDCNSMESLLSSSWFFSAPVQPLSSCSVFTRLKRFYCDSCRSMKKLFPVVLLSNLLNLEEFKVRWCDKMEEIIATKEDEESSRNSITIFNLPNLKILELDHLPELKSIYGGKMICNSLQQISVLYCPKLRRIPVSLPLLDNGQPSTPPSLQEISVDSKEWWESVEWEQPKAKDALLPFVSFSGSDDYHSSADSDDIAWFSYDIGYMDKYAGEFEAMMRSGNG